MGFFQRLGNGIARFMYGRNGMDQLNRALFWGYMGIFIAQLIFSRFEVLAIPALTCEALLWVLMVVVFFRMFSKNLPRRQAENQKWVNWQWRIKNRAKGAKTRHADRDHKYFTCKSCKAICRVPVGKGKILITCPKCGANIQART